MWFGLSHPELTPRNHDDGPNLPRAAQRTRQTSPPQSVRHGPAVNGPALKIVHLPSVAMAIGYDQEEPITGTDQRQLRHGRREA
jgi:hypothetical protein